MLRVAKRTVVKQKNKAKKVKTRSADELYWLLQSYESFPTKMIMGHVFATLKVKYHCN